MSETASVAGPAGNGALAALALVCGYHRVAAEPAQLTHDLGLEGRDPAVDDLLRGAKRLGLRARTVRVSNAARLRGLPKPAILELADGRFVVLAAHIDADRYRIVDPCAGQAGEALAANILESATGRVVLLARRLSLSRAEGAFSLSWFVPFLWRYRRPLGQVLVASLFIQVVALLTPLLFQIVIDKVLVHNGAATLLMVVAGLAVIGVFQALLQHLRSYVLSHTTSRIDVELGAHLFGHMMRLPLAYFETRPTGQTVARVREMETIRDFLTGQGLSAAIDCVFAIVLIAVLALYSPLLTLIVLGAIPAYLVIAFVLRPLLRDRTVKRFNRGAASQQFLVESVVGVQTIKAAAIEPQLASQWEDRLAGYVRASFDGAMLASLGQNAIQYVSKLTTALVLYFGATAVMSGEMTVGALIAFNMIMGQVTAPILRLSQLWQDFQQVQISVERIGDILNAPTESRSLAQAHLPPAKGAIRICELSFRYRADGPEVLRDVSLDIPVGQVLGIVGPSGSGKSTFTKLLQRLHAPDRGQVLIDGVDVAQVDPAWLRRQVGVVLQENLLFNRSVHENIALANPAMPRAEVIRLARLSGADAFISRLPLGYDTIIEERGANLSGGQRQRLAIARALAGDPRILIFDEATSALDYESERIIQDNMQAIVRGRTVIVVAHRLAAVSHCDRIVAFKDGRIVEDGTHAELLRQPAGVYGNLWRMQAGILEKAA